MLLGFGPDVAAADAELAPLVTEELLRATADAVPEEWLADEPGFTGPDQVRAAYVEQLTDRLRARDAWLPGLHAAAAGRGKDRTPRLAPGSHQPDWLLDPRSTGKGSRR